MSTSTSAASGKVVNYIGCVYADIDRDYFNDNTQRRELRDDRRRPGLPEAQGQDALDYVRYRHGDNDLVRAARQQDFLRQLRNAAGARRAARVQPPQPSWRGLRPLHRHRQGPAPEEGRSSRCSSSCCSPAQQAGPRGPLPGRPRHRPRSYLTASQAKLDKTVDEFLNAKASKKPRQTHARRGRGPQVGLGAQGQAQQARPTCPGLEDARREGEDQAIVGARASSTSRSTSRRCAPRLALRGHRAAHLHDPRRARQEAPRLPARGRQGRRRRVLRRPGHDLARPADPRRPARDARGQRPQARAATTTAAGCGSWRGGRSKAVYWVSNTLTQSLEQAPDARRSPRRCRRLGQK